MRRVTLVVSVAAVLMLGAVEASPATAAQPHWQLSTAALPSLLEPGGEAEIAISATNLGDVPAEDISEPITITGQLPPALTATEVLGFPLTSVGYLLTFGELSCTLPTPHSVSCTVEPFGDPLPPFETIDAHVAVQVGALVPGEELEATISGGGAPPATARTPLRGGTATPFGISRFRLSPEEEAGGFEAQAGAHPFQFTGTLDFNQTLEEYPAFANVGLFPTTPELTRNLTIELPPGLIGNPTVVPRCSDQQFAALRNGGPNVCPASTAIGVSSVTLKEPRNLGFVTDAVPLFNLVPTSGEPARFGFVIVGVPVILDTSVRSDGDYGIDVNVRNTSQTQSLISSRVTFWGVPADPRHDNARGWGCLGYWSFTGFGGPCEAPSTQPRPFLTLPTSCSGPLHAVATAESWKGSTSAPIDDEFQYPNGEPAGMDGCNRLPFDPTIAAEPTSDAATSPTGLNFDLDIADEGLDAAEGIAQSDLKKAVVTLPEGFTTNPSVAEGLHACTLAEYEAEALGSEAGENCPNESKIGDVEVESPLVEEKLTGSLFIARQGENPFHSLLALYMVVKNPQIGVIIKAAGEVHADPVTGQLTTTFDELPQLPFSHFHLSFRQGQRAPLITPPSCGTFTVKAALYPWSDPGVPRIEESSFKVTAGPEGGPCPSGGVPPFHPNLTAGTQNNAAGTYSPFYVQITRKDSEQEITHFSIKLPPGLSGKLAGVAKCSDAQIAAAKAREHELGGSEELEHPSCPADSEVGHTLVGTGVGDVLAYAPGKLYLAGPYRGSQISIVSITAAKVGPFDLGTVVIREGLKVNPETAQVSVDAAGSDPIPHIVDGIPIHLRDIRIYVDRPDFTINPTSCEPTSTAATVLGSGQNFASEADDQPVTVTSPFQAADCASLAFRPKLALSLKGKTKRGGLPKLTAVVTYPKGGSDANIAKTVVTLPPSEFLEQGHIGSSCTRVQFNAGAGNGAGCPAKSILGKAKAITPLLEEPLEGLVYLRSNGGERKLPDLVAALHSEDIDINLVGFISSLHKKGSEVSQIRNTFAAVPDAPVERFTLELFGGKKGLLVNSTNICKGTHKATSEFTGQNGKLYDTEPAVAAQCGKKGKKSQKGGKKKGGH